MSLIENDTNDKIAVHFFQTSSSEDMEKAFKACQQCKLHTNEVSIDDIDTLPHSRTDVYVLEQFKGDVFKFLASKDCLVVGPKCLYNCLSKSIPIPENESPVFSLAMHGLLITASKMSRSRKEELASIICYMGGFYIDQLTGSVTHVVSDECKSPKCQEAIEHQIPIMTTAWVKTIWEASQSREVMATDAEFFKYRLPPFKGLHISCSNLNQHTKRKLQALIEAHGGIYMPSLEQNKTVILVIGEPEGKKFQHAQLWNIPCVKPSWIFESAEKGYPVRSTDHLMSGKPRCSTPTSELPSFMSNADISVVPPGHESSSGAIDDTNMSLASISSVQGIRGLAKPKPVKPVPAKVDVGKEYKKFIEQIDMTEVSKAGLFLDGCKIYLSGFTQQETEKLKKIINRGGATFFTQITDRLTHVIIGSFDIQDGKILTELSSRPHTVTLEWLLASIKEKGIAPFEPYVCLSGRNSAAPVPPSSPLSHKGVELLKSNLNVTPTADKETASRKLFTKSPTEYKIPTQPQIDSLNQKAQEEIATLKNLNKKEEEKKPAQDQNTMKDKEETNCSEDASSLDAGPFFEGLKFVVTGFEDPDPVVDSIEAVGGKIVSSQFKGKIDFTVVPLIVDEIVTKSSETVTGLWVEDCYEQKKVVKVEYFHRPITQIPNKESLEGAAICITGFTGKERVFINHIAVSLGARVQDSFSRKDHPEKGIFRSTHLICKSPSGSKFNAAIKWGVPTVNKDWVLSSLQCGTIQPVDQYTVNNQDQSGIFTTPINPSLRRVQATDSRGSTTVETTPAARILSDNTSIANKPDLMNLKAVQKVNETVTPSTKVVSDSSAPNNTSNKEVPSAPVTPAHNKNVTPTDTPDSAKRKFSLGSTMKSPFHIDTPESPYGRVFLDDGEMPSPSTRKKWKQWIDSFPDLYEGSPDVRAFKRRRPSTPLAVLLKQIWVKFGGAQVEGIDPETGDILPDGPYKQWAHENETLRESQATPSSDNLETSGKRKADNTPHLPEKKRTRIPTQLSFDLNPFAIGNNDDSPNNQTGDQQVYKPSTSWEASSSTKPPEPEDKCKWDFGQPKKLFLSGLGNRKTASPNPQEKEQEEKTPAVTTVPETMEISDDEDSGKPKQKRIFVISNVPVSSREKYEGIINTLGGEVSSKQGYDPESTHLLIEKPVRSEKLLCFIASGKWVLHTSYLSQCYQSRMFLPEEDFEWGNERASDRLPRLEAGTTEYELARAAHRWRLQRSHLAKPCAFRTFKAVICTSQNKIPQYRKLLEAGGATVLSPNNALQATHVFWDENAELPVCISRLSSRKILILKPIYLGDYLTKTPLPDNKNYMVGKS